MEMSATQSLSPQIIAVCGKGGVGKTSVSAMITKLLLEQTGKKILAIDADPAVGLATALGITVSQTVDDIRNDIIQELHAGNGGNREEMLSRIDYDVCNAMTEKANFAFLAIGRSEQEGCYCQLNTLLKEIITSVAQNFDYIVIDGEAGVEQVNRRVMQKVTHLLLVSDVSLKGRQVVETIKNVAHSLVRFEKAGVILNKVRDQQEWDRIPYQADYLGWLGESETLRQLDMEGKSILGFTDRVVLSSLRSCLGQMDFGGFVS